MDGPSRLRRRGRLLLSRVSQLTVAAVESAPSALAGIAVVVIAFALVLILGLALSATAALLL